MVGRSHGFFARTSLVSWRTTTTKLNIYSIVCQVPTPSSATSATSRRWPWTVWCALSTTPSVLRPWSTNRSMAGQIFPRWRTPSSLTRWAIMKWLSLLYFSSFRWAGCSLCRRSWEARRRRLHFRLEEDQAGRQNIYPKLDILSRMQTRFIWQNVNCKSNINVLFYFIHYCMHFM